ncbi:MAG TPA: ornithine cyclodeaminase family protein [Candidatus Angelobacter sp.]|nr:ornithine cyclodeaminase family protein [Candidatus Angelobacter sp.]
MTLAPGTLLLTRRDISELMTLKDCVLAVEQAFRLQGEGRAPAPGVLGVHAHDGGFHIKAGTLPLSRNYFAAKANANFPGNPARGLPTIQGVILLFDAENGQVLAAMDSMEITTLRTGAATAVAAKYLARKDSRVATICGCGNQGRVQLNAVKHACPLEKAFIWDIQKDAADRFALAMAAELGIAVTPVDDLPAALRQSDICVTCTPAKKFFIREKDVPPGMFIAAVGADNEDKQELDPVLLGPNNKVVADVVNQCAAIGDLHHALTAGIATVGDVYAELGEIVCRKKPGRTSAEEITIFDSTGMALQDVASAALVYEKAVREGKGVRLDFGR